MDPAPARVESSQGSLTGAAGSRRGAEAVDRLIWTAIGTTVNLAARLQGLTRTLDAAVIVDGRHVGRGGLASEPAATRRGGDPGASEPRDVYSLALG